MLENKYTKLRFQESLLIKPSSDRGIFTNPLLSNDKGIFTEPLPSNVMGIFYQTVA
jgi:hypothetical protein